MHITAFKKGLKEYREMERTQSPRQGKGFDALQNSCAAGTLELKGASDADERCARAMHEPQASAEGLFQCYFFAKASAKFTTAPGARVAALAGSLARMAAS